MAPEDGRHNRHAETDGTLAGAPDEIVERKLLLWSVQCQRIVQTGRPVGCRVEKLGRDNGAVSMEDKTYQPGVFPHGLAQREAVHLQIAERKSRNFFVRSQSPCMRLSPTTGTAGLCSGSHDRRRPTWRLSLACVVCFACERRPLRCCGTVNGKAEGYAVPPLPAYERRPGLGSTV